MNLTLIAGLKKTVTLHPSAPLTKGPNWNVLSGSSIPSVSPDGLVADFLNPDPNGGQTILAVSAVDDHGQASGFILVVDVVPPAPPAPPAATLDPSVS